MYPVLLKQIIHSTIQWYYVLTPPFGIIAPTFTQNISNRKRAITYWNCIATVISDIDPTSPIIFAIGIQCQDLLYSLRISFHNDITFHDVNMPIIKFAPTQLMKLEWVIRTAFAVITSSWMLNPQAPVSNIFEIRMRWPFVWKCFEDAIIDNTDKVSHDIVALEN